MTQRYVNGGWHWLFLLYLLIYPLPWLWGARPSASAVLASLLGVTLFLPLFWVAGRAHGWRRVACALGMLAIGCALEPFGGIWGVFAVYAAAVAAYLKPTRHAVVLLLVIAVVVLLFSWLRNAPAAAWGATLFFGALTAVSSLYSARLETANAALAASRDEARRLAASAERERIARDLHDVLGQTLTVVAVKSELASKLLRRDPEAAARELEEIHQTARSALAEVRAAVTGMRSASMATELAGARAALDSAGIVATAQLDPAPLSPPVETTLAYVLREAVTNVVRHSGATRCRIQVERRGDVVVMEVADDGHGGGAALATRASGGITGMRLRLAGIGGTLAIDSQHGTTVVATVPVPEGGA